MRQDRYDTMPPKGIDNTIFLVMKGLSYEQTGGKRSASARRADAAAEREAAKDIGISVAKRKSTGKRGVSRGGQINKKTRASFELSTASIEDSETGKGHSVSQAKEQ